MIAFLPFCILHLRATRAIERSGTGMGNAHTQFLIPLFSNFSSFFACLRYFDFAQHDKQAFISAFSAVYFEPVEKSLQCEAPLRHRYFSFSSLRGSAWRVILNETQNL
ncbi:MAG: hypothetical protein IJG23_02825 [Clostridia bacterium]|nr:hypothetical protein [Clostridia bacterium]